MDRSDAPDLTRGPAEAVVAPAPGLLPPVSNGPRDAAPVLKRLGSALAAVAIIDAVLEGRNILLPVGIV